MPPVGRNRTSGYGPASALSVATPPIVSAGKNFKTGAPSDVANSTSLGVATPGTIGNPLRATAAKGEEAFRRYSEHVAKGVLELLKAPVEVHNREFVNRV